MNIRSTFYFVVIEATFLGLAIFHAVELSWFNLILLSLAASFVGRAVAYLKVFEWLRKPFAVVVPHGSGVGETVEPKPGLTGWRYVFANLICCPVCAGTWAALVLMYLPLNVTYVLAVAAGAWFITYLTEAIEWSRAKNWHHTGRLNGHDNGEHEYVENGYDEYFPARKR